MNLIIQKMEEVLKEIKRQTTNEKPIMNLEEACAYTGISASTMYKLTSARMITFYKPAGKLNYFKKDELDHWLLSNRQATTNEISAEVKYKLRQGGLK